MTQFTLDPGPPLRAPAMVVVPALVGPGTVVRAQAAVDRQDAMRLLVVPQKW